MFMSYGRLNSKLNGKLNSKLNDKLIAKLTFTTASNKFTSFIL